MQLVTFLGLMFAFMLLYSVFLAGFFPAISGGYTIDQFSDTKVWKDPVFVQALKIVQLLYTLMSFLAPALIFAYLAHPRPTEYLGLRRSPKADQLLLALLILICAMPFVGITAEWNAGWNVSKAIRDMENMAEQQTKLLLNMPDFGSMFFSLILLALLPAIAEEVFFRGVLQRLLTQIVKNGWIAVVITSVLFSAIHMQFLGFVPRVVLGFVMGAIYYLTGNLWLSIAGHFLNNGLQVVLVFLFQAKIISYDVMSDEHTPVYYGIASVLVAGFLLMVLNRRAKAAGQTFALPVDPEEQAAAQEEDQDSIFKD